MRKDYFLELAKSGLTMPIGADLVLRAYDDHEAIVHDGIRLGQVVAETARRFQTPLAVPLMDLELEKRMLLGMLDIPVADIPTYHFDTPPSDEVFATVKEKINGPLIPRLQAHVDAVRYIATETDLIPIGMAIGPFSLMTKLVADPITPIALAGYGISSEEEETILTIERALELAMLVISRSLAAQAAAGAKVVFIAEPAANIVYLSPNQIEDGSDIFERFVLTYNRRVKQLLDERDIALFFHDCGELTNGMVEEFGKLHPAVLSLGSSRNLWEDAAFIPKDVVLFGNLPSKRFYSDALITCDDIKAMSAELVQKMKEVGHPFILGSECDVLSVPGHEETIMSKVQALQACGAANCACV